jgi:magnesium-transporting ATPase (P-type)
MAEKDPESHESDLARLERRWSELLNELRVTQAGTQIMMGFLLTLVFQPAFSDLDPVERNLYVGLVVTATLATVLAIAPVSFHRILFRHPGGKARIVTITHILLQVTLVLVAFVLSATLALIFNIVLGGWAGVIGGVAALAVIAAIWVAMPLGVLRSLSETYRR